MALMKEMEIGWQGEGGKLGRGQSDEKRCYQSSLCESHHLEGDPGEGARAQISVHFLIIPKKQRLQNRVGGAKGLTDPIYAP